MDPKNKKIMKEKSKIKLVFVYLLYLVFIVSIHPMALAEVEGADLKQQKKYADIKNPKERLNFCIEVLSNGTVKRGATLSELQEVCDNKVEMTRDLEDGNKLYTVAFEKAPEVSKEYGPDYPAPYVGWYLRIEIDKYGKLIKYYLSNLHK